MSTHVPLSPPRRLHSSTAPPRGKAVSRGVRRSPARARAGQRAQSTYAPGSPARARSQSPPQVDGRRKDRHSAHHRRQGNPHRQARTRRSMPHDHGHVLAEYHLAGPEHIQQAIAAAAAARREWAAWPWEDRAAVLLRAAELLATSWRPTINAATMLGQSKTAFQSEIDAASRDDRLLALQRLLRAGALQRAAGQRPWRVELDGVPQPGRASSTRSRRSTSPRSAAT